jgi:hypothetical protein
MKKITTFICVIAAAAILTSCSATMPLAISSAPIGNKVGTSSTVVLFGTWHLNSDYGVGAAARNGGIKGGVATADIKITNYVIYQKKEIIVQGN